MISVYSDLSERLRMAELLFAFFEAHGNNAVIISYYADLVIEMYVLKQYYLKINIVKLNLVFDEQENEYEIE